VPASSTSGARRARWRRQHARVAASRASTPPSRRTLRTWAASAACRATRTGCPRVEGACGEAVGQDTPRRLSGGPALPQRRTSVLPRQDGKTDVRRRAGAQRWRRPSATAYRLAGSGGQGRRACWASCPAGAGAAG
jgi:hypothetical protein